MPAKRFTKEEEELLKNFSRHTTTKSAAKFYIYAFIVSLTPLWLFWRMYEVDPWSNPVFVAVEVGVISCLGTFFISMAYKNFKFVLKHKFALKIEDSVTREVNKMDLSKVGKKDREDKILSKKHEVSDFLAENYSIFFTNLFFVFMMLVLGISMGNVNPYLSYGLSVGGAAGLTAFISTSGQ